MAIGVKWYGKGLLACMNNDLDLASDTIKLALVTGSYTPDQDAHDFRDDLGANELSTANGYTAGGVTLGSKALSYDATSQQVRWDFADPSWTLTGSITFRYGVVYKSVGTAATDPLICYIDFGASQSPLAGTYTLTVDAAGLLYLDVT